eukprot:TRINITY_DN18806_c0_g1_i1.p1 TRINITY_DN18806_c0_g1~~TRINITY_DN18806_c0_g1_i1.p1  ORF type:complete len:713 (+),score=77.26 TRINITY_DN18806_c0_g1_i1:49-2187(+)
MPLFKDSSRRSGYASIPSADDSVAIELSKRSREDDTNINEERERDRGDRDKDDKVDIEFLEAFGGKHSHDFALRALYDHWHGKGLDWIIVNKVSHFLRCFFAFVFVVLLTVYVNWSDMVSCEGSDCSKISFLLPPDAILEVDGIQGAIVVLVAFLLVGLFLFMLTFLLVELPRQRSCRKYLTAIEVPQINIKNGVCGWDDLVRTLHNRQISTRAAFFRDLSGNKFIFDELHVAQCIMRYENYAIALLNSGKLNLPWLNQTTYILLKDYLIAWAIFTRRTPTTIDADGEVWKANTIASLRTHCLLWALILLLGSPFWVAWRIIYNFFKYGVVFKNDPGRFFLSRTWSTYATICFREYNELPHYFELRMANSRKIATDFIDNYPDHFYRICGQTGSFLFSALFLLLLLLTFLNESVVANMSFLDKPLLWWMPFILSIALFFSRLGYSEDSRQLTFFDPKKGFEALRRFTHWQPTKLNDWDSSPYHHSNLVFSVLVEMFPFVLKNFIIEVATLITTPYHLYLIAKNADVVVTCVRELTHRNDRERPQQQRKKTTGGEVEEEEEEDPEVDIGSVLCFSTFKKMYSCGKLVESGQRPQESIRRYVGEHEGKLDQSILGFLIMYPNWGRRTKAEWRGYLDIVTKQSERAPAEYHQPRIDGNELTQLQTSIMQPSGGDDDIEVGHNGLTRYDLQSTVIDTYFTKVERRRRNRIQGEGFV